MTGEVRLAWFDFGLWRGRLAKAWVLVPFLCLFAGSAWVRAGSVVHKRTLDFDEAISLMAAAGRLDEYDALTKRAKDKWVDASHFLTLSTVDDEGFAAVRESLLKTDIHPPFYFWLINAVARVGDGRVSLSDGVLVNLLAHLCGVILLYLLAHRLFESHAAAALTTALWTFGSGTLTTTATVRQYEVLAVTAIATTLCLLSAFTSRRVALSCAALCSTLWMALCTQLQAVTLLVFTAAMLMVVSVSALRVSERTERVLPRVLGVAGAVGVACVLAYWTYPRAIRELTRRAARLSGPRARDADWSTLFEPLGTFLGQTDRSAQVAAALLFVAAVALTLYHGLRLLRRAPARERELLALVAPLGFLVVASIVGRQQSAFAEGRALATRYWAIAFPFCALMVGQSVVTLVALVKAFSTPLTDRLLSSLGARVLLYAGLSGLIGVLAATRPPSKALDRSSSDFASVVPLYDRVVVDSASRGSFGRVLPFLDPHARVFLTDGVPRGRQGLNQLRSELRKPRSLLIVGLRGRGTSERTRRRLFREIQRAGFKVRPATHVAAFRALAKKSVVFFAQRVSSGKSSRAAQSLLATLGATPSVGPGGFVGVLDSRRWVAQAAGARVGLSSRRLEIEDMPDSFSVRARSEGDDRFAMIRIGSRTKREENSHLLAAVWDRSRDRLRFMDTLGRGALKGMYAAQK